MYVYDLSHSSVGELPDHCLPIASLVFERSSYDQYTVLPYCGAPPNCYQENANNSSQTEERVFAHQTPSYNEDSKFHGHTNLGSGNTGRSEESAYTNPPKMALSLSIGQFGGSLGSFYSHQLVNRIGQTSSSGK